MKMINTEKFDIHVHIHEYHGIPRYGSGTNHCTPKEIREIYKKHNITKAVILPNINLECEYEIQNNEQVANMVKLNPDLFYWFCNIDPRMGSNSSETDFSYFIEYYKSIGAKGVGELCSNLYFDDPRVENLFYHCEKQDMPVIFHIAPYVGQGTYGIADDLGLPRLEKSLQKFPKMKFLMHSQCFWTEISADVKEETRCDYPKTKVIPGRIVELFTKYNNIYGDLSAGSGCNAIARDPEFGYAFLETFQDRLLFGTDYCSPVDTRDLSFFLDDAVKNNKISVQAYNKICRDNFTKMLKLDII